MAGAPPIPSPGMLASLLEPFRRFGQWVASHVPVPAPLFFAGAEQVWYHAGGAHPAFLLGRYSDTGWWYYFPVIFFFKSPIPFLIFGVVGVILLARVSWRRRESQALAVSLAPLLMFLPVVVSSLNIGVRHILPLYPPLTIAAAFAVHEMWRRRVARPVVAALLVWCIVAPLRAHPDYLSYFNECAGEHPEEIAVDSNLDWGQDLLRLVDVVRAQRIDHLHLAYFGSADVRRHLPQADDLPPGAFAPGWIAVSEMTLKFGGPDIRGTAFRWLSAYTPVRRVGRSIRLYFVGARIRGRVAK